MAQRLRLRARFRFLGWILLSFHLIAGGLVLAVVTLATAGMHGEGATYGVMTVGAAIGALASTRLSSSPRLIETLLGAALLAIFFAGCIYIAGESNWDSFSERSVELEVFRLSLVTTLGALAGGLLGVRNRHRLRELPNLGWACLSALMVGGYVLNAILILVALGVDLEAVEPGWAFMLICGPCLLGAFSAQALAKVRRAWACSMGGPLVLLYLLLGMSIDGDADGSALVGVAVLSVIGLFFGALGTLAANKLLARAEAGPEGPEPLLPTATLE